MAPDSPGELYILYHYGDPLSMNRTKVPVVALGGVDSGERTKVSGNTNHILGKKSALISLCHIQHAIWGLHKGPREEIRREHGWQKVSLQKKKTTYASSNN